MYSLESGSLFAAESMAKKSIFAGLIDTKNAGKTFAAVSCYDPNTARRAFMPGQRWSLDGDSAGRITQGCDPALTDETNWTVTTASAVKWAGAD